MERSKSVQSAPFYATSGLWVAEEKAFGVDESSVVVDKWFYRLGVANSGTLTGLRTISMGITWMS